MGARRFPNSRIGETKSMMASGLPINDDRRCQYDCEQASSCPKMVRGRQRIRRLVPPRRRSPLESRVPRFSQAYHQHPTALPIQRQLLRSCSTCVREVEVFWGVAPLREHASSCRHMRLARIPARSREFSLTTPSEHLAARKALEPCQRLQTLALY